MSLLVQRPDVSEFRQRFKWLALGALVFFFVLIGRAAHLQIVHGADNQAIARENIVRVDRDRQGVIRVFQGNVESAAKPAAPPAPKIFDIEDELAAEAAQAEREAAAERENAQ